MEYLVDPIKYIKFPLIKSRYMVELGQIGEVYYIYNTLHDVFLKVNVKDWQKTYPLLDSLIGGSQEKCV